MSGELSNPDVGREKKWASLSLRQCPDPAFENSTLDYFCSLRLFTFYLGTQMLLEMKDLDM